MKKFNVKINNKNILESQKIVIPFSESFNIHNSLKIYYENKKNNFINEIVDYEKTKFSPINDQPTINILLHDNSGNPLYYDFFGFTNDDLFLLKNNFINSYLRLNFFDSKNQTNMNLMIQNDIKTQLLENQRDINGELLDVSGSPVSFVMTNPTIYPNIINKNYNLFFFKNLYEFPIDLYVTFSFLNAKTGISYNFVPKVGVTGIADQILEKLQYRLYRLNNKFVYAIIPNDHDVIENNTFIQINLYATN